jgi:hypothetical protein
VLVGIGTPLLGIGTFAGVDILRSYEPWRSAVDTGFAAHLPTVSDTVDVVLPGHRLFGSQLRAGNVPDWNPLVSGGTAFADGTGVGFWSPLSLPFLLLPAWLAPAYVTLLEMLVAIGGSFLFLRRLALSRPAAVLGGVLFASSGFMVTWANWPHTEVAALLPALFWTVERFVRRRTVPAAVPIAVVLAAMLAGGFPAVVGYALYAAAPYLLLRLWGSRVLTVLRAAAVAGGAALLGAGAVAVLLLPFLGQLRALDYLAQRGQTPDMHLPAAMLATLAVPDAFGTEATDDRIPYWGTVNSIESLSFVGAGALVLVLVALVRPPAAPRGVRAYLAAGAEVTVVLGYVGGPVLGLAQHLPVFSDNPVFRIRVLLGFFLAMLAAFGFDALARTRPRRVEVLAWLVAAAAALVAARQLLAIGSAAHEEGYVRRQLLLAVLFAGLVLVAAAVTALPRPRVRGLALAVVPVVVAAECLSLLVPFWPRSDRADFYPETGAHRYLADHLGTDRFGANGLTFLSGTNVYYGLRSVTGHAFTSAGWRDLLLRADPGAFPNPGYSRFSGTTDGTTMRSPILDLLSVRYFAFAASDPVIGPDEFAGPVGRGTTLVPARPVTVPIGAGPVRGVGPVVTAAAAVRDPRAALELELVDAGGRVLATGSRRLYDAVGVGRFVVPVAGEGVRGAVAARLTLRSDEPLRVAGGAAPQLDVTRPGPADGLTLAYAGDGAVIYRRATALPRFLGVAGGRGGRPGRAAAAAGDQPGPVPGGAVRARTGRVGTARDRAGAGRRDRRVVGPGDRGRGRLPGGRRRGPAALGGDRGRPAGAAGAGRPRAGRGAGAGGDAHGRAGVPAAGAGARRRDLGRVGGAAPARRGRARRAAPPPARRRSVGSRPRRPRGPGHGAERPCRLTGRRRPLPSSRSLAPGGTGGAGCRGWCGFWWCCTG